jgi:uncharacterized protein (DUF2267 family)
MAAGIGAIKDMPSHIGGGEIEKVMHSFPREVQSLFTALAAATT